jgi:CHAD domain-containing protein
MALDPDSLWKDMKKAGRKLFQALGELRDMQVMREWMERLNDRKSFSYSPGDRLSLDHVSGDPVAINLLNHAREAESKQLALKDLNQFDRKQWSGKLAYGPPTCLSLRRLKVGFRSEVRKN